LEENSKTLRVLEQEFKNVLASFDVQHNKNEIKQDLQVSRNLNKLSYIFLKNILGKRKQSYYVHTISTKQNWRTTSNDKL